MPSDRVSLLRRLRDSPVSEEDAMTLFGDNEIWGPDQLRAFLVDLCIAFDRLPIVPDDCIEAALRELQLDANDEGRISQMEWKSFFVYLLVSFSRVASGVRRVHPFLSGMPVETFGTDVISSSSTIRSRPIVHPR
jgi:hypothetical protein